MNKLKKQVESRLNRYEELGMASIRPKTTNLHCWVEINLQLRRIAAAHQYSE